MANPSIYTVAKRAGVSIATVSRVLAGSGPVAAATRERVLEAAAELRWSPSPLAQGLAGKGLSACGIVFPDLLGHYYSQVVLGFEEQAVAEDRSVLILATHGRPNADAMVTDLAGRVDGLVVMDRTVSDGVVQELDRRGVAVVLLARPAVGRVPAVRTENVAVAERLTDHLLEHGHRRLAFLGNPEAAPDVEERWRGFSSAHRARASAPPDKPVPCGFGHDDAHACALELLEGRERPDAVVCANDELALAVYEAARDLRLDIPRDLAVTGWDDLPAARAFTPGLTTVRQPMRELGRRAGALLSARIAGSDDGTSSVTLRTQMVVRQSCGCPLSARRSLS